MKIKKENDPVENDHVENKTEKNENKAEKIIQKINIKSEPKKKVIEFILNVKDDEDFVFVLENCSTHEGINFVKAMRTELSRIKNMVRNRGRQPKYFKMILKEIKPLSQTNSGIISLLSKNMSKNNSKNNTHGVRIVITKKVSKYKVIEKELDSLINLL